MKLEFSLLVYDDTPRSILQAVETLREHLDEKGFDLKTEYPTVFSEETVRDLSRNQGKEYDLVAVDYNLGQGDFDGSSIASILRRELEYTDMVFYSSIASADLHGRLTDARVTGVFVATRDELDEALVGLADTVIGKAVDLNHMRGIAMAEVAELDVMMEETLAESFDAAGPRLARAADRTADRLKNSLVGFVSRVDAVVAEGGIAGLVGDGRLFSSAQKYHAIRRISKQVEPTPTRLSDLDTYEADIVDNRNLLAHAREVTTGGVPTLRSPKRDGSVVTIDDAWMIDFRRKLRAHRSALRAVCADIKSYFCP